MDKKYLDRKASAKSQKRFYVTTPIYYVNDIPHIGHAYSTIAADVLARYYRRKLGDENVFFLAGLDENSQKTTQAAEKAGVDINKYVDDMASKWQETWRALEISNDDFIRTTEKRHVDFAREFFKKVYDAGDIYKGKYEGWYCVGCEAYKTESESTDGNCNIHQKKVEWLSEENYFFKLSKYGDQILKHIEDNPDFIAPIEKKNEIVSFIKGGLEDISVTRSTLKWGIVEPIEEKQVIYVWFDALLNYISANPKKWPADLHIVGKDILRFHTIIWPAMLLSAGYPLPKKVFGHGFFTIDGVKISKSLGNAIDPVEIKNKYGNDTLRYFLFREIPFGSDGDFSFERLGQVYKGELSDGLGNLVARVAKLAEQLELEIPTKDIEEDREYSDALENIKLHEALAYVSKLFNGLNEQITKDEPWKESDETKKKELVEGYIAEIQKIAWHLVPFMPETAQKIQTQFSGKIKVADSLFPRI